LETSSDSANSRDPGTRITTVLHVITGLNIGGAETMLYKLVARSDRTRFRHVVVSLLEIGPVGTSIAEFGISVHTLGMDRTLSDVRALPRLLRLLRTTAPDLVQTWLHHANFIGLLGASVVRRPVVWTVFGSFNPYHSRTLRTTIRLCVPLSRLPAAVVSDSEAARDWYTRLGFRPKHWLVIPNGFDTDEFRPDEPARQALRQELGLPSDAVLIGLIGRFNPVKGHRTFLEAAGLLSQELNAHFVLVGPGVSDDNAQLIEYVAASGVRERVHLLGTRPDLPRVMAALDIATSASYSESFPNVIGEAMASGVPCVVTDVGEAARMVGDTGRVVPPSNAPAMAAAWRELIELGREARRELGRRARARVEALYGLDSVVRRYEALYERFRAHRGA
jgi:glycosyltransferase involved in cell wall biosynthesis